MANNQFGTYKPSPAEEKSLWDARRIIEAVLHPQTSEPIPAPFRFSAFAPLNVLIVGAAMSPITAIALTGQVANVSYNVAVNYCNRNMSNPIPTQALAQCYALTVGTALGIATGMNRLVKVPAFARIPGFRFLGPYFAVAAASSLNVLFVRKDELWDGVEISSDPDPALANPKEVIYGTSTAAAQMGLAKCMLARVIWSAPPMLMPPVIMHLLGKNVLKTASPRVKVLTEIAIIGLTLLVFIPPSLAIFPENSSMPVSSLEASWQGRKELEGVGQVYYYKGL